MSDSGITKLEAVNVMFMHLGQARVSALDSTGTWPNLSYGSSEAGEAEYVLDYVSRRVQERGFHGNTDRHVALTAADIGGSVFKFNLPSNTLKIMGSGNYATREYAIRAGYLYDRYLNTDTFADGDTVTVDIVRHLNFIDCDPTIREMITDEAVQEWRRMRLPDALRDTLLAEKRLASINAMDRVHVRAPIEQVQPTQPIYLGGQNRRGSDT